MPGCCCDCAVKGASAAVHKIKANNFFMSCLITCRCISNYFSSEQCSDHLNLWGNGRSSVSILIIRARELLVISEYLNTGEVQASTVSRRVVKSRGVIKRRAIGIKWNCVWIDRNSGKFVSGLVAGRNNNLTD